MSAIHEAARRNFAAPQTVILKERPLLPRMKDLNWRATLQPSACVLQPQTPPPLEVLIKTKGKVQFDRAVDRTVEAFFHVFQGSNRRQFSALFLVSAVGSAEGRKPLLVASSSELAAFFCQRPPSNDTLPPGGQGRTLPFVRLCIKVKLARSFCIYLFIWP